MHPKWFIALGLLFVVGSMWSGICEQQYLGGETAGVFYSVMDTFNSLSFDNPLSAGWSLFIGTWTIIQCAVQMLLWDYAFFTGYLVIFRLLGIVVSVSLIISLIIALKGASSA